MKILCVGQSAYDIIVPVEDDIESNKKYRFNEKHVTGGGSSANAAVLLSKWGDDVYFAGAVGDDFYGKEMIRFFEKENVSTEYLDIKEGMNSPISIILTNSEKGSRTIIGIREDELVNTKEIPNVDFDLILMDGYDRKYSLDVINKNKKAIKIVDAGTKTDDIVRLCEEADYIIASHDFAEEYSAKKIDYGNFKTLVDIYNDIRSDFPKAELIITLEEHGSFTYIDGYKLIPGIKADEVDTTGAGDIFHGAFCHYILRNKDILENMRKANIASGLSLSGYGARGAIPSIKEVEDRFKQNDGA